MNGAPESQKNEEDEDSRSDKDARTVLFGQKKRSKSKNLASVNKNI